MSWILNWLAVLPFALTFLAYCHGLHTAQKLLPKERREHGDNRTVPDLYSPESSHRWLGIIVSERTGPYSQRLRRALFQARLAVVLLPFAFFGTIILLGLIPAAQGRSGRIDGSDVVVVADR